MIEEKQHMSGSQWQSVQVALALILGSKTADEVRQRALQRLRRRGVDILPLVLTTLNSYPEITTPEWPAWPVQYTFCARLLLHLSQAAHLSLEDILHHPVVRTKPGPVLWTAIIEVTELERAGNLRNYEALFRAGLAAPWATVRYAAAMALGTRSHKGVFQQATLDMLRTHLDEQETFPVRLAAAHALLHCGEELALEMLRQLSEPGLPGEVRKAALFILATTPMAYFSSPQLEDIMDMLLWTLHENNIDLSLQAAHTLGKIGGDSIIPKLRDMLVAYNPQIAIAVLQILEDMTQRRILRQKIIRRGMLSEIVPYCSAEAPEIRRQACHTLSACGGEYTAAVLATLLQDNNHPGHLEAIESLHVFPGVLRPGIRERVLRWLFSLLTEAPEASQAAALAELATLLWKAHRYQKRAWQQMALQVEQENDFGQLLQSESAWVRQRTLELLIPLGSFRDAIPELHPTLEHLLSTDHDSGVRACAAYICGQIAATWAIPTLILALLDDNEHVSQTALHALGQLASAEDVIVVYVMRELTHYQDSPNEQEYVLAQEAGQLLKKLRPDHQRATLHSSD